MTLFKKVRDSLQRTFLVPVGLASFEGSLLAIKVAGKVVYLKVEDLNQVMENSVTIPVYEMRVRTEQEAKT